ncbi:DMT family transporter [Candidatus Clostridium radicumherbarum]|uniref:DMT family transporter n=1 Tax=Candidatus Clostridium radicumherbarum TaxID=3381662 RepID=A0ABW8TLP4_9CLOT
MLMIVLASIAAGASIVLGRNINSMLANKIGLLEGTFFNYVVGLFFSFIFLLISSDYLKLSTNLLKSVPIWAFLGGLLGVIVVSISNFITPKISAFYLTLIIFVGQLFTGIIIDYFSQGLISLGKIIGGLLVFLGLSYNLIIDKRLLKEKTC